MSPVSVDKEDILNGLLGEKYKNIRYLSARCPLSLKQENNVLLLKKISNTKLKT
jgi:hypothetical protein